MRTELWDKNTGVIISIDEKTFDTVLSKDGYYMRYKRKFLDEMVDTLSKRFPKSDKDTIMRIIGEEMLTDFMTKYLSAK